MANEWEPPRWQQEGRTGPNGPRYASLSDRNKVRAGKSDQVGKAKKPGVISRLLGRGKS